LTSKWEYEDEEAGDYEWEYGSEEEEEEEDEGSSKKTKTERSDSIPLDEQDLPDPFSAKPLESTTQRDVNFMSKFLAFKSLKNMIFFVCLITSDPCKNVKKLQKMRHFEGEKRNSTHKTILYKIFRL